MQDKTCSFTGHRQILHIHSATLPDLIERTVLKLSEAGYTWFQSGGALGFDTLSASTVIRLREQCGIKLRMIIPCRNQAERWCRADRAHYNELLGLADDVIILNDSYTPFCMHERNRMLVDSASVLVSYLSRERGGTAYTARYAASKNKKIINLADLL